MTEDEMNRALSIASAIGARVKPGIWCILHDDGYYGVETVADICHELAHFLVSPTRLRSAPYYGLGNPNNKADKSYQVIDATAANLLEAESALLGSILCFEITGNLPRAAEEFQNNATARAHFELAARNLNSKGLLLRPERKPLVERFYSTFATRERPVVKERLWHVPAV